jgi:ABC-type uncharacterized transport system permease subunit
MTTHGCRKIHVHASSGCPVGKCRKLDSRYKSVKLWINTIFVCDLVHFRTSDSLRHPPSTESPPAVRFSARRVNVTIHSLLPGVLAALLYLITGFLLGIRLNRAGLMDKPPGRGMLWLAVGAVLLHALVLLQTVMLPHGINMSFFNALSVSGWLISALLLISASIRPVENLGIILLPFAALTLVLALLLPGERIVQLELWPLELHIVLSMVAYALLTLAAVQALLLAVQESRLRRRHPVGFMRGIPPLVTMESLLFQMIGAGFVVLSLSLLTGLLFLEDVFAQHLVHKTVLSIAAWTVFGTLLWGRWRFGWRGRTAIRWTLGGFLTLMLAYFGSKLVLELILQR